MPDKAMNGMKELRGLSEAELQNELEQLRRGLWDNRIKAKDGAMTHTHLLSATRRQIARVHTILREQMKASA